MIHAYPREAFRITPDPESPRYFVVHVARSQGWMMHELRRCFGEHEGKQVPPGKILTAQCSAAVGTGKNKHLLGYLFFCKDNFGSGIVAHELAHAAFRTVERDKLKVRHWVPCADRSKSSEEHYALVIEHLTKTFWREAYRVGLAR